MSKRSLLFSTTFLTTVSGVLLATSTAQVHAADPSGNLGNAPYTSAPAVDGINGKIVPFGGSASHRAFYGIEGSLQFPLGHQYGLQIDGIGGGIGGHGFGQIAGHLFWRQPSFGLLGIYSSYTYLDQFGGVHAISVGVEGERYLGPFTLQGVAGVETGNTTSVTTTTVGIGKTTIYTEGYDIKTRFFDQVNLKYYLTDNVDAYIGHRYQGGKNALALGSEFVLPIDGQTATTGFFEARAGEDGFYGIWGGLKYYFGYKGKSLIKRHRENDDPEIWDSLYSILNSYTSNTTSGCPPGYVFQSGSCEYVGFM